MFCYFLVEQDISQTRRTFAPCPIVQLVKEAARTVGNFGNAESAHHRPFTDKSFESIKSYIVPFKDFSHIDYFKRITQVRLIGAVFQHRFIIRNTHKRWFRHIPLLSRKTGKLLEHAMHHRLKHSENIILSRKRHFHVKLIELTGAAVSTGILITETRRDLKVLVKTGNHQKLFKLLRCLRQSVKFSGMNTGRHKIVPRTFRT